MGTVKGEIVRSLWDRFHEKFIPEPNSGCWLWVGSRGSRDYGQIWFNGIERYKSAHRVSWILFKGKIPDGLCVLHHCDVEACVNPDHLFLGTNADNKHDSIRKGRNCYGIKHQFAKLTPDQVKEVRKKKFTLKKYAERFNVSLSAISAAQKRKSWKSVI